MLTRVTYKKPQLTTTNDTIIVVLSTTTCPKLEDPSLSSFQGGNMDVDNCGNCTTTNHNNNNGFCQLIIGSCKDLGQGILKKNVDVLLVLLLLSPALDKNWKC
jgi:hypothetical protein